MILLSVVVRGDRGETVSSERKKFGEILPVPLTM